MAKCINCGEFTKFENGLCLSCYNEKKNPPDTPKPVESSGISDRDKNYRYNMIKGRIAETLIQELFLQLGYNVFRYGMENTVPGILDLLKGVKSEVAEEIKRMPDFVIQKDRDVYFVEVKFRAAEKFTFKDLPKNYAWENVYIILVSKRHIKCITYQELKDGDEITPTCQHYLGNRKEFDLDKAVIISFCSFAVKFFHSVETPGEK